MADGHIDIKNLNKADVLAVLYNASRPLNRGFMGYDPKPMTREQAQALLDSEQTRFDYLKGRVMKIDLSGDQLNPRWYDQDNGQGAAQRAIASLNATGQTNPEPVQNVHVAGTRTAVDNARAALGEKPRWEDGSLCFGLGDVADVVGPKIDEAVKKLDDLKE